MSNELVLVTGGSGFIGVHCILQLLNAGYLVRTTVRSLKRADDVRAMLKEGGCDAGNRLTFVAADLGADAGWVDAVAGSTYVLHVASPTPLNNYAHEDEMIIPAREGVLRVLRAAQDAKVKRVVLTSAYGAVGYGHPRQTQPIDERTWSNLDAAPAYQKLKTLAERAAWDFIAGTGTSLELSVVNPVAVFGPALGPDYSHSLTMVQRLMSGSMFGCPKLHFSVIDVRDVASLHLLAMTHPDAKGERFLASAGADISVLGVANILKSRLGTSAKKVPTKELPNWIIRLAALRDPVARALVPHLGLTMNVTSEKARRVLGWKPRPTEEAIVATAESFVRLGLI
ncbi:SDR family oxidoreductase [Undibacterium sp. TJN25]|uniref:SDR family oxidoreductase n=1 Tax=Undibacterium sp. TJN25 TaxID=3413056 RepID=UPI003BF398FD